MTTRCFAAGACACKGALPTSRAKAIMASAVFISRSPEVLSDSFYSSPGNTHDGQICRDSGADVRRACVVGAGLSREADPPDRAVAADGHGRHPRPHARPEDVREHGP